MHMDYVGQDVQSSAAVLSSILSLYLLPDPPSSPSALSTIIHLIAERKPFTTIESNSQVLHKWNTRVSSLLQSKSAESRYWGICLAKATIENGGEGVAHTVVWAKLLSSLLNRPEGSVLLERVISTLTTSFDLISTHTALSRDLNSLLPGFFSTLLNLTSQNALLPAILTALHKLIPDHASVFRPSFGATGPLMLSLIDGPYSPEIKSLAAKVYVDLHHSTHKGASGDYWRSCLLGIVAEIHMMLDRIFEVVEEDTFFSHSVNPDRSKLAMSKGVGLKPIDDENYSVFMMNAIDRIRSLLIIIKEFLSLPTKQRVNVPLGQIVDLVMRVYAVRIDTRIRDDAVKQNVFLLHSNISILYTEMNALLVTTIKSVGPSFLPHFRPVLKELSELLPTINSANSTFYTSIYSLISRLLHDFGAGLHSSRETKVIDCLAKTVLVDISSLTSIATIPPLSISPQSRKRKHNSNKPVETSSSSSNPPLTIQIVSGIDLVTEILHLTPLLSLSTRSSIDQVLLSSALRLGLAVDVTCALHRAIVASVRFPAGVVILPHAIRILERDSTAEAGIMRDSAVKGMTEIEGIIHLRLPMQKTYQREMDDGEEQESMNGNMKNVEDTVMKTFSEETVMKTSEVKQFDHPPSEPISLPPVESSNASKVDIPPRSLPSFVTESRPQIQSILQVKIPGPSTSESILTPVDATTTLKRPSSGNNVFMMNEWKDIRAKNDEEDEEIPEIDMEFDSDEE